MRRAWLSWWRPAMNSPAEWHRHEFEAAVQAHMDCLERFGEDDPRTQAAAHLCMALMPDSMFRELMEIAHAQCH